jgi:methyl-accepting chemotaxis protein
MALFRAESLPDQATTADRIGIAPRDIADDLNRIGCELNDLIGSTEEEFLGIGASLHEFQQRAGDITAMAAEVVGLVTGEEIGSGIVSLAGIVERMGFYLGKEEKKTKQSSSTLLRILGILDNVDDPLSGFRKINKVLRMLGISTRIESTRLAEGAEGFDNLAKDVEQLYLQINEKASSVNELKKELSAAIRQTIERVRSMETAQRANVGAMLENAGSSLGVLREVNARCSGVAASITTASMDVSRNIAEVVMSMQFHDITRQQMEHAGEALAGLCSRLGAAADSGAESSELIGLAGETCAVCELQAAQLGHAFDELAGAVENILENLRGVAGMEAAISIEANEMTGVADKAGSSFFTEMEADLSTVAGVLERSAAENRNLDVALESVDGTISEITLFVDCIETIGEEIELIAINAQIKAARTGEEGAALGVLAEAIQRLSLDARTQTGAISAMLNSITDASGELCRDVDAETSSLEAELRGMMSGLGELLRMLRNVNNRLLSLLENLDKSVESLNRDIDAATSGITVQQRTGAILGKLVNELAAIASKMRTVAPGSPAAAPVILEDHSGRYTMHSERKIHEAMARRAKAPDGEAEFIPALSGEGAPGEYGDNVELF